MQDKVNGSDDEWVWTETGVTTVVESSLELLKYPGTRTAGTIPSQKAISQEADRTAEGFENLCMLNSMDEPSILENLQKRFHCSLPYTSANDICIAVNPYTALDIYNEDKKQIYAAQPLNVLPAHIFALSRASYDGMRSDRLNQSLLVSGESGAGKTESVKLLLDHIAFSAALHSGSTQKSQLFEKILMANPLLESFGNAKTSRNFNSSRFGKYVQLHFDGNAELQRSTCTTYLLEKSRAVNPPTGDSNFHIFHELLAAPEEVRAGLCLSGGMTAADFAYTAQVVPSAEEHAMYAERFKSTHCAFRNVLGLSEDAIQRVLAVLAGVLYLGQLQLIVDNDDCGSTGSGSDNGNGSAVDDAALTVCASLLQVDPVLLHQSLTTRLLVTSSSSGGSGGSSSAETVRTTLSQSQALLARDALAKEVYARLFAWIVQQVNDSTHLSNNAVADSSQAPTPIAATSPISSPISTPVTTPVPDGEYSPAATASIDKKEEEREPDQLTISLLDIFGFENFTSATTTTTSSSGSGNFKGTKSKSHHSDNCNNGFEQLCINYCNEKLQHMFTNDVIVAVQQEFAREGLLIADSHACAFASASAYTESTSTEAPVSVPVPLLRLFEHNRTGLINLLNEECVVPGGCEASFLAKLLKNNSHSKSNNSSTSVSECSSVLQTVPFSSAQFTVHHYADSVTYTTHSFIEKNRDTLPVLAAQLLASSSGNSLLATLFAATATHVPDNSSSNSSTNRRAPVSTMGKFRAQLDSLLHTVRATRCRYIRCLKPNSNKNSAEFDASLVLQQLRSGGVVQAVRVSRAAYPHKMTHRECLQRYCNCWGHNTTTWLLHITHRADAKDASSLIKRACEELWQCAEVIPVLLATASVKVSAQTQSLVVQVGHTMVYFAAGLLEALDRSKLIYLSRRILSIQARVRAWLQRKQYLSVLKSIVAVQAVVRRGQARAQYKMSLLRVTAVQQWYRVCLQRRRDRLAVAVAGTFARWFDRVSTMRHLRTLTQAVMHRRHHHRHDYQQHQVQQQKSLDHLPAVQDLEHMGLVVNAGSFSRLPLQPSRMPSSVVTASTQTDPCLCVHCGRDPSTYVATIEVGSSVAAFTASFPPQLPPHLSPGPTALLHPPQQPPVPCRPDSKLVQALRALQSALLKEWERSLLLDVQESIDAPTALVLAVAAVLCSALCNSNM